MLVRMLIGDGFPVKFELWTAWTIWVSVFYKICEKTRHDVDYATICFCLQKWANEDIHSEKEGKLCPMCWPLNRVILEWENSLSTKDLILQTVFVNSGQLPSTQKTIAHL